MNRAALTLVWCGLWLFFAWVIGTAATEGSYALPELASRIEALGR